MIGIDAKERIHKGDERVAAVNQKYLGPQIANFGHNIRFVRKFTLNVRTRLHEY